MNRILISHYTPWTPVEVKELKRMAAIGMPAARIALQLGRTPPAVRAKARLENIALCEEPRRPIVPTGREVAVLI